MTNKEFYNEKGKRLLSPSRAISMISEGKFDFVKPELLEKARIWGQEIGEELTKAAQGQKNIKKEYLVPVKNILCILKDLAPTEICFEKHIKGDIWHGFLDIELNHCFIEMKARNHLNLEIDTIIQCEVYKKITGKDYIVIHIDRRNGNVNKLKPTENQIEKAQRFIQFIEGAYNEYHTK